MGIFDFLSGGVGDLLGGVIGGGMQAAGAAKTAQAAIQAAQINANTQQAINNAQLSESARQFAINQSMQDRSFTESDIQAHGDFMPAIGQNILKEASILGVNPISLSGATPGSGSFVGSFGSNVPSMTAPTVSGASPGGAVFEKMGAALQALDFGSKQDELKLKGLELDNVLKTQDIVSKQVVNSELAQKSQPGIPPQGRVSPQPHPFSEEYVDTGGNKFRLLGKETSQSAMNYPSIIMAPWIMYKLLEENMRGMDWSIKKSDIPFSSVWNSNVQQIGNPAGD